MLLPLNRRLVAQILWAFALLGVLVVAQDDADGATVEAASTDTDSSSQEETASPAEVAGDSEASGSSDTSTETASAGEADTAVTSEPAAPPAPPPAPRPPPPVAPGPPPAPPPVPPKAKAPPPPPKAKVTLTPEQHAAAMKNLEAEEVSKRLFQAASNGKLEEAEAAIAAGADIEYTSRDGWTPLAICVIHHRGRYEEVARLLLTKKANPDAKDERGRTPLFFASQQGLHGVVPEMLKTAKHLDATDSFGVSALNHATHEGHVETVKHLIAARADVHRKSGAGGSAHVAATKTNHKRKKEIQEAFGIRSEL